MDKVSTEIVRRVYDDGEGVFVQVGPDGDGTGCVSIATTDKASREWFGEFSVSFRPEIARAIGHAMIAAADEAEKESD